MSKLIGSLKIRKYLGCSEATFMQRVTNEELPVKRKGGEFIATTKALDEWLGVKADADAEEKAAEAAEAKAKKERAEAEAAEAKAKKERAEADAAEKKAAAARAKAKASRK